MTHTPSAIKTKLPNAAVGSTQDGQSLQGHAANAVAQPKYDSRPAARTVTTHVMDAYFTSLPMRQPPYWQLTDTGRTFVQASPAPLSAEQVEHLAVNFMSVKLKTAPDAASLDESNETSTPIAQTDLATSSPQERLNQAILELRTSVAGDLLDSLLQASPTRFEHIVLDVLHSLGYGANRQALQQVGGSGDGGIDGVISLDALGLEKVYVQAKRWQNTVGRPDLQAFYGALAGQKAKRGVFITTSGFTAQAVEFALSVEGLVLVDGKRLVNLMLDHEVGVSSQLYKVPRLDSDYFDESLG